MIKESEKINEYMIVRAIAILLVVIGHCVYYKIETEYGGINYDFSDNITITRKLLLFLSDFIYSFHMPLYFILSGALFKNSIKKGKLNMISDLVSQKAKRLLIPFLIVTIFYSVPLKYISGYYVGRKNIFKDVFIGQILLQGNTHLWFLPTLFTEFIITWLTFRVFENQKSVKISVITIAVFLNVYFNSLELEITSILFLKYVFIHLIYFYIGYYFETIRVKINKWIDSNEKSNLMIFIVFLLIMILFNKYYFRKSDFNKVIKNTLKILISIIGSYLVYLVAYQASKVNLKNNKIINRLSDFSFGIYLYSDTVNYFVLYVIKNSFGKRFFYNDPGIITIFFIRMFATFFIGLIITAILKKNKVKYIC